MGTMDVRRQAAKRRADAAAKVASESDAASEAVLKTVLVKRVITDGEFQRKTRTIESGKLVDEDFCLHHVEDYQVVGHARGRRAIYRLTSPFKSDLARSERLTYGGGGTEIEVSRSDYPLFLAVYPPALLCSQDEERVRQEGKAVYIVLGNNAAFDAAFLVQAAPAAVVREVFDHDICVRVLALLAMGMGNAELRTKPGTIQLALQGWVEAQGQVEEAVELTLDIAARIEAAFERIAASAAANAQGGAYRSGPAAETADTTLARATEEVRALEALRKPRERRNGRLLLVMAAGFLSWMFVSLLVWLLLHNGCGF